MKTYYIANVTEQTVMGFPFYNVELRTANEDGYSTIATVKMIDGKKQADDLAMFWMTGGHEMVMTVVLNELVVEQKQSNNNDDIPCGTDVEEMRVAAYVDSQPKEYQLTISAPFFGLGESSITKVMLTEVTGESILKAMNEYDAELAGLSFDEAAGYEFVDIEVSDDETVVLLRTTGLGPSVRDNCLCIVHVALAHR